MECSTNGSKPRRDVFTVVPFALSFKDMSPPTKELIKITFELKISHGEHPVLRWNINNIFIRTVPSGNIKADKEKYTEKIDDFIATIMALDCAIMNGNKNSNQYMMIEDFLLFRDKYKSLILNYQRKLLDYIIAIDRFL